MKPSLLSALVFLFDLLAPVVALVGAYLLRFNFEWPTGFESHIRAGILVLLPAHAFVCRWAGLYKGLWVFASLPDLKRVLRAVALTSLFMLGFAVFYRGLLATPRTVVVLFPILLILWMAGGRVIYRMLKEYRLYGGLIGQGKPVVVVGAGRGGAMLVREIDRSPDWRVVGLIDDDENKWGREVLGYPVFGGLESLPEVIRSEKARHVILSMPSAASHVRRRAADIAVKAGAHVFTVPGLEDVMSGGIALSSIRPLEIEDLLGREAVEIDTAHVRKLIADKVVLVTGAGGSIGSELCRQLARFGPARILLFEQSEYALYSLEQWFSANRPDMPIVPLAGDVKDASRVAEVFERFRPQLVFHAAAYKHVPLMEVGNAWQAVRNNVLGTLRVADCARRHGVEHFVLISTDKAVNPTNVMGATKRLAEMICEALQSEGGPTRFAVVRFGNVLGSTGSVIPKFQSQIARGGPITVTHPEITRYFMSIPEAAQLVLQSAAMGSGGEIFVMDMGEPVKIVELARNMIRLSGFTEQDIRIEFTGLRPGEKLYEELLADSEHTRETPHRKLRIASSRPVAPELLEVLRNWLESSTPASDDEVRRTLVQWIPEYKPFEGKPQLRIVSGGAGATVEPQQRRA